MFPITSRISHLQRIFCCGAGVSYKDYGATVIHDNGKKTELKDEVPELEI